MAEGESKIKVDVSSGMFVLGVFLLIILFWGEPDIHDAIIHGLMTPDAASIGVESP